MAPEPAVKTESARPRLFVRGGFRFAAVGFAVTAILLLSMAGSAWWAARTQAESLQQARADDVRRVGALLARSAELLLADNEVSPLRRIVTETARESNLSLCRIVLPGGQVIADANPSAITLLELPAQWPGTAVLPEAKRGGAAEVFLVEVPNRGSARLEVAAQAAMPAMTAWATQAGIGLICVAALIILLLLYRWVRSAVRGIGAIREALLARQGGQTSPAALRVTPDWGPEARAWNDLLGDVEECRRQVALERTKEHLQTQQSYTGHLAAACDALSQGLILVGKDLRADYINGAAAVLLQGKREQMLGADIATVILDPRVQTAVRESTTGPMRRRTIVEVQRDGPEGGGFLRFVVRPVRRDDSGVAMIVIEDITQQRVAEEARHAFVAQATHELRTPLTNIRLYAEMALDEGKNDPAVRANCLNIINQETFRLDRIVADVLSIAEIEAGTMALKKDDVRLAEVFPELAADYEAQAKESQVRLTFNLPPKLPVIRGDRDKVRLALHNLVGNALKYTLAGGQVTVTVSAETDRVVVEVADTGIGMSEEDQAHIFEKFYRANDRRVAAVKGSGLGLAIAREVVRLHGGDISVQSVPDKGSTFTLVLPIPQEST